MCDTLVIRFKDGYIHKVCNITNFTLEDGMYKIESTWFDHRVTIEYTTLIESDKVATLEFIEY